MSTQTKFTLDSWVLLRIKLDEYTVDEITCRSFASASLAGFEALKAGALSVELIPA